MSLLYDVSKEIDQINRNQHAKLDKKEPKPYARIGAIGYTKKEMGIYSATMVLLVSFVAWLVITAVYSGGL